MRGPLSVRTWTATGEADRHLDVRDLSFTKTAPGGHASASFTLPAWIDDTDPALSPLARCKIYDTRTGATVWGAGFLEIPGRSVSDGGQTWDVGVVGPTALLSDKSMIYHVVDKTFDDWEQRYASNMNMTAQTGGHPTDEERDALMLTWPEGVQAVGPNSRVTTQYTRLAEAQQRVGGIHITHLDGGDINLSRVQAIVYTQGQYASTSTTAINDPWRTTETTSIASAGSAFNVTANGPNAVIIRSIREGTLADSYNINGDLSYVGIVDVSIRALRYNKSGTIISGVSSYAVPIVAGDVVEDALYRFTELVDLPNAQVTKGTHDIDQLAYPDAVRFSDVLGDLALLEPGLFYYIGASDDTTNLHSFDYLPWKQTTRYEMDTRDGWSQPGGESELCNRISVTWTDHRGRTHLKRASIIAPALDAVGRVRDAEPVEIGVELGSAAAANRIGERILNEAANPPTSGTLTVASPVRDLETGQMVLPHEIEPGEQVRLRDIDLTLRCTQVSYSDDDQTATLSLGAPPLTADQLLSRIERRRNRRKR